MNDSVEKKQEGLYFECHYSYFLFKPRTVATSMLLAVSRDIYLTALAEFVKLPLS